ncbi:hypothetical protein K437DRAFT_270693 [Tilletiaria anomala UBC 951]|uniref:Uncharacterized protein n=1 Tax=Tilletiaria anomala (strain ATCC 24038 / CBS 436.72 / UBC 951) TaxID=1037660 RepID=A0A066VGV2_TILAU|nr:uncharacterized protein K437DRAFT_270693 [Tilletiaria anomala UBC 951]KDN37979.1 hypothetical protein K437DRAFT_270693 [Tilletiaria anomala UBC 951]
MWVKLLTATTAASAFLHESVALSTKERRIYKGADNFMYWADGTPVDWSAALPPLARTLAVESLLARQDPTTNEDSPAVECRRNGSLSERGCGETCNVKTIRSVSDTTGWSVNGGGRIKGWISGGFTVTQSHTVGDTKACGGSPGDRVCIWYQTDLAAYTVQNKKTCKYEGTSYGRADVMFSPNSRQCGLE